MGDRLSGPVYLTISAVNLFGASGDRQWVKQVHIVNTDSSNHTFSLYVSAGTGDTTSGTELAKDVVVPAKSYVDLWFPAGMSVLDTEFLVATADADNKLVATVIGKYA